MTIRQLFVASCIVTASLAQAVSMKDFDRSRLNPYIIRAQEVVNAIHASTERSLEKTRELQKEALKNIKHELENVKDSLKESLKTKAVVTNEDKTALRDARQLYKAFKHEVYKVWKKTGSFPALQ